MRACGLVKARAGWVAATLAVVACGLAVRRWGGPVIGEHVGNVLWGVMWVLGVRVMSPRARVALAGGVALAVVWGIECFQLTPWPARWSGEWVVARYLVGGAFEVHDLIGGAIGVGGAMLVLARLRRGRPGQIHLCGGQSRGTLGP